MSSEFNLLLKLEFEIGFRSQDVSMSYRNYYTDSLELIIYLYSTFSGMGIIHCFINVLIVWIIKLVFGPSKKSVILTAAFTMVRTYIVKLDVYRDTNIYIY